MNSRALEGLAIDELERIDSVCETFERGWKSGVPLKIEPLLGDVSEHLRAILISELVKLDVDYRSRLGESPDRDDYDLQFPGDTVAVDRAFETVATDNFGQSFSTGPAPDEYQAPPFHDLKLSSRFRFRKFHARGGLGEVYLADDVLLNRVVAIKFPRHRKPGSNGHSRLIREAEITSRLKHPGIIPVLATSGQLSFNPMHQAIQQDDSCADNLPFYIMPFVEGPTLKHAIDEFHNSEMSANSRFASKTFDGLLRRLVLVCNTVEYAHSQMVFHRDIKPANIMLGEFGETFLLDWGLARTFDENQLNDVEFGDDSQELSFVVTPNELTRVETKTGRVVGTIEFASPEQVLGKKSQQGPASDVYSLGATLYYLLTGRHPVCVNSTTRRLTIELFNDIKPTQAFDSQIPVDLDAICKKAMSPTPVQRYESVAALTEDLESFLADQPVSVHKATWQVRSRRWVQKRPGLAAGLAASLASAAVVTIAALSIGGILLNGKARELSDTVSELQSLNRDLQVSREATFSANEKAMKMLRALSENSLVDYWGRKESFTPEDKLFLNKLSSIFDRQTNDPVADNATQLQTKMLTMEAYFNVGKIQRLLGNKQDALAAWEKAWRIWGSSQNALADARPDSALASPEMRELAVKTSASYGQALALAGKSAEGKRAVEWSLDEIKKLSNEFPGNGAYRRRLATNQAMLAHVFISEGKYDEALGRIQSAIKHRQPLVDTVLASDVTPPARTGDWQVVLESGEDFCNEAFLLNRMKIPEQAIEACQKAIEVLDQLQHDGKTNREVTLAKVKTLFNHAESLAMQADYSLALSRLEQAFKKSQFLTERYPNISEHVDLQILIRTNQASYYYWQNDLEPAMAAIQYAWQLSEDHGLKARNGIKARIDYSEVAKIRGLVLLKKSQNQKAIKMLTLAVEHLAVGLKDNETGKRTKLALFQAATQIGQALTVKPNLAEAIPFWDIAIEHASAEKKTKYRTLRAVCLAQTSPRESLKQVEQIVKSRPASPQIIFNLACACALAGSGIDDKNEKVQAAEQAIDLLHRSRKAGYFRHKDKVDRLRKNGSFQWLKDDDRFREFMNGFDGM